jgi:hypothetical protein
MPQIFVFTAGNPEARQHLVDSIRRPIDDAIVFGNFDEPHHEELDRIRDKAGGFYAWGAVPGVRNIPTWEQMERDDFVLCVYDSAYRYVSRLLAKYDNPACAEAIWGTNDEVLDILAYFLQVAAGSFARGDLLRRGGSFDGPVELSYFATGLS